MDKINILWVINALGYGGAEKQLLYMYDILKNNPKYEITILYYAKMADELNLEGINLVFVDKKKIGPIKTIFEIRKVLKEKNIHIMHALGGGSANIYGRCAAALCKNVVPIGAVLGKKHFASFKSKVINSFLNMFGNWWTVNNTELIPILKHDLKFLNEDRIRMIHNGFIPADKVNYQLGELTEYDTAKGDDFVFAVVGRLDPIKNYELFIKAAAEILKSHPKTKFWVIGNGTRYDTLVALTEELGIQESVKFWGFRSDVDSALARMDVFVQTSFTEGSPNAIAEAMRANLPIISTRSTDLSEMIVEDENGYVVESDDLDGLVGAMEKMLGKSEEERKAFGKKSNELFMKYFLDESVIKEYEELYTNVLERK